MNGLPLAATLLALLAQAAPSLPQAAPTPPRALPLTVAESSKFTRTSTSVDVERHVDACCAASPRLVRLSLATSSKGRDLPLVLVAEPPLPSLAAARANGKVAVLVMANIHGGEVEGKEAVQILLRELAQGAHAELLAKLVVAFVPNYNPDGNDAIDRKNRPDQNGPVEGVGQRANGQGFDLNRDFVKCEAPETRGLLKAVCELDPLLVMDLHTTDGSFHGYDLTYAGVMHPATSPELEQRSRSAMLPWLRAEMKHRGLETFDYGDFDDNAHPEKGWSSFDHKPRYGTNYFGLTNRLTLLSEAYSHEPFEKRVRTTREFVLAALRWAAAENGAPRPAVAGSLPTRGALAVTRASEEVLVGACREEKDEVTGLKRLVDTDESHAVAMPVRVSFEGREPVSVPLAWAIDPCPPEIEPLLALHGLVTERLSAPRAARVRTFLVTARKELGRPFQGHQLVDLEGLIEESDLELPAGALLVPAAQPLARLAFVLLEPRSDDGLATWSLLGPVADPAGERFAVRDVVAWTR
jgi:hypothetical protein